ncbi:MAG TPA: hypothetical protein VGS13_01635 [Stellaceae bacterium]|nr:hypothetical protein [Stellaceae bacterium]
MDTAISVPSLRTPMQEAAASPPPARPAAIVTERRTTGDKMSLRRGFLRLVISLVVLWMVFWTVTYVLHPFSTLTPEPASFEIRVTAWGVMGPCLVAALILCIWSATGFRRK